MNLTSGSCATTFQMPNVGSHVKPIGGIYVYLYSKKGNLYLATCLSSNFGSVPGFYKSGRCYFGTGHHLYSTTRWNWVGAINGHSYYSSSYTCNIFGGYAIKYSRPLFYCGVSHGGWMVPGSIDQSTGVCIYLNGNTKVAYKIVTR